jgi:hypothetical protein
MKYEPDAMGIYRICFSDDHFTGLVLLSTEHIQRFTQFLPAANPAIHDTAGRTTE